MAIQIHDSLTDTTAPLTSPTPRRVRMYAAAHSDAPEDRLSSVRTRAFAELLEHHLRWRGYAVELDFGEFEDMRQRVSLHDAQAPRFRFGCALAGLWLQVGTVTLPDALVQTRHEEVVRYFLLRAPYRDTIELGEALEEGLSGKLDEAEQELEYLYATKKRLADVPQDRVLPVQSPEPAALRTLEQLVGEALDEDLDVARALDAVRPFLKGVNELCDHAMRKNGKINISAVLAAEEGLACIEAILGFGADNAAQFLRLLRDRRADARGLDRRAIVEKIAARTRARANKDFGTADRLQRELTDLGVSLLDGPAGTEWTLPA